MSTTQAFSILAIDDDPMFLRSLKRILINTPYEIATKSDPLQGLTALATKPYDLVLLDLKMPGRDGMSVLEEIMQNYPDLIVLMLTGHGGVQDAVKAVKLGAADFLEKPCPPNILCKVLAHYFAVWEQRKLLENVNQQAFDFPDLVGESPAIEEMKNLIARVAVSDAPVLVLGESGTGKELAARAIHHHSLRKNGPFVVIDCAAINESVLESELFGYEKGAFTGADRPTQGLIRAADGGTLFFDEIGELPLKMQAKLLRTLQEREVRPVGSTKSQPVDIRVIAATNRDLEQEVAKGHFRADLFFRISAIPIIQPPLRERSEDIPLLVTHLLENLSTDRPKEMGADALRLLQAYHWPGNVRELQNVLRRALALAEEEVILPADLPATLVVDCACEKDCSPENDSLEAYEQTAVENALRKTGNNKRQAANLLGISEATLYRKLKQFGLSA
ncbi:sigma-54-dependent Fis family transcriptional regulator [Desulfobulbus rhabdoformis]|uniref:sigma-54-dependent transcriptional regulator n=1 Tax=Desulfobulbus rhabdoformis TaxID=34032 RepID=UPI00196519D7|nr:sigma-54 dependent transcriptional regulator [Desulfobulbus rhabdoformis]MBM9616420.1 sigma-54-dependent Fis family transcriptional regulator [Desulfobulbus rhabdoformis]